MRTRIFSSILIQIILLTFVSCKTDQYKVNTKGINPEISIKRLENDLFGVDPAGISEKVPELKEDYGSFLQLFSYVINIGDVNDTNWSDYISLFCTDKTNNEVYAEIKEVYPDLKDLETELKKGFSRYLYYFPERSIPSVYTCITGFNNSLIVGDSVIGIGLDLYLGADCEYYPKLGFYGYQSAKMTPSNIVPDFMYAMASTDWDFQGMNYSTDNTLSEMIHEGKLMYFVKSMISDTEENLIFGYTPDQMEFCRNNEGMMWQYLVENDLLFDTDQFTIRKLTGDAPFTSYFTNQSPGKAAVWLGFRIVESYMKNNPEVKLEALMNDTDFQKILEKSKYSPK